MSSSETRDEAEALKIQRDQLNFAKKKVSQAEEEYDRLYRDMDEQSANYAKNISQRNYVSVGQANISRAVEEGLKNTKTQNQARGLTGANSSNFDELLKFKGEQAKGNLAVNSRQAIFNQQQAMTGQGRKNLAGKYQTALALQEKGSSSSSSALFKAQKNIDDRTAANWEVATGVLGAVAGVASAGVGAASTAANMGIKAGEFALKKASANRTR